LCVWVSANGRELVRHPLPPFDDDDILFCE
jgi:hypothetical protein